MRRAGKRGKAKGGAKLPVTKSSRSNESSRLRDLEKRLADALGQLQTRSRDLAETQEQQTATSEILRVISSSPTNVQPVFAAVLRSAARLCDASDATIFQVDGDGLRIVAHEGPIPITPVGALPLIRGTAAGRAVLDRRTIHVPDVQAEVDEYPESSAIARSYGFRTVLNVPLLRGPEAIGAVSIRRTGAPRPTCGRCSTPSCAAQYGCVTACSGIFTVSTASWSIWWRTTTSHPRPGKPHGACTLHHSVESSLALGRFSIDTSFKSPTSSSTPSTIERLRRRWASEAP
jgi:hypothetical protein